MSPGGEWFRHAFDDLYLTVYQHRDRGEAARFMAWAGARLSVAGSCVLDLACGAARFAEAVTGAGGRYVGLDLSGPLLLSARGNGPALDLVRADMRCLPLAGDSIDVVLSMFTSFGYFDDDSANRDVLRGIAGVLRPGGRVLIDHMNAGRVQRELVPESSREGDGLRIHERRAIRDGRVVKEIEVTGAGAVPRRYRESVRLFDEPTLVDWAVHAGLTPAGAWGDYDGAPFTSDAPRMILAFERRPVAGEGKEGET